MSSFFQLMNSFTSLSQDPGNTFSHTNGFQPRQTLPTQQAEGFSVGIETITIGFLFTAFVFLLAMSRLSRGDEDTTLQKQQNRQQGNGHR
jgi:hypothetical protein